MDLQTIITYFVVALAAGFVLRTFIRQFSSRDAGCTTCSHCGPEASREMSKTTELIQVETPE